MINIAELLKDAPTGIKLYSPLFGEVEFIQVTPITETILVYTERQKEGFSNDGCYFHRNAYSDAECLLFPSKYCRTWEGWKLPVQSNFKAGDWVVIDNCHNSIYQVDSVREYDYMLRHTHGGLMPFPFSSAERLSLWTIQDAKDGDVLATNSIICLFKKLDKDGYYIISHCIYTAKDGLEVIDDEGDSIGSCGFKPATKEDRKLLFRKMKEAGYEWDADKKELRKIKPHYDIANLRAGMPVLVRDANDKEWRYVLYSHNTRRYGPMRFNAGATIWNQCIPFNDDTKHLLGTTDMPYECYINW